MFCSRFLSAFVFCCICLPGFGNAQSAHSSLTGILTDSAGGVLQGAKLTLDPVGAQAITNREGVYLFPDVSAGTYKLNISFIGFAPYSTTVKVDPGQTVHADAVLQVGTQTQQVIVTDTLPHGEAEAINRERTAPNILQVLPAEVIRSLPNANVADAIGRLPSVTLERDEGEGKYVQIRGTEPRYSNVTIDGVNVASPESVRQIKLDIVPSDLVESVEISKTLTANQDGDAIGGSVNLRTRSATDRPTISLFGIGGFTPIFNTRGVDQFGATVGQRFGKKKQLGILFGGTYDWNGRGINDVEPAPSTVQCDPGNCGNTASANAPFYGTYGGIDLRDYRYYRTRYGFEGSVDYRLNENSSVYIRGLYSHFDNFGDRWVYSPGINSYTTSALQGGTDGSISMNASIRRPVQVIGSTVAGGRHGWGASTFTWEASAGRSATEDKGYSQANFGPSADSPLNNIQYGINLANPYRPKFIVQNGLNVYDASQYVMQGSDALDVNHTYSPQLNLSGAAAYSRGYNLGGHLGTFEVGGKFRNAHKFQDSNDVFYDLRGDANVPLTPFLSTLTDRNYYNNSYTQGPFANYSKITNFFNTNPGMFISDTNLTHSRNDPNNWDLTERVSGGYLMNTIEVGKWRLYAGLRFEGTNESVLGYNVLTDASGNYSSTSPVRRSYNYLNTLPSAEARYTLSSDSDIRVAYGRGIARPDYGDIVPFVSVDDSNQRASAGNPDLKPTTANNYDVLYEHYLNPLGVIQAGLFYKDLHSPIYSITTNVPGLYTPDPTLLYQLTKPENGSSAWIAGFEVSIQQRLSYLPGLMSGLGISANYSYTDSRANGLEALLGRTDHPHLQRQAPHTWNISPTYDKGRISLRVGIAYNAANIFSYQYSDGAPLGITGPSGDQYLYTHLQVDAQASIRLAHGLSGIVYGLNLNNEVFGFYQGSGIWPIQREYYEPTYGFGMRWEPVLERARK